MNKKSQALEYLHQTALESIQAKEQFLKDHADDLYKISERLSVCLQAGGKLLVFGNGGSASDAQHMAAEMVGRMLIKRRALPAIALTTDSSNLTAISNDYSYAEVFSRQVEALAKKEDVIVAISTSGNSPNVLAAVEVARNLGCYVIALTGGSGGKLLAASDVTLNVRLGKNSCRIQETHIFIIHSIIDLLDRFTLSPA